QGQTDYQKGLWLSDVSRNRSRAVSHTWRSSSTRYNPQILLSNPKKHPVSQRVSGHGERSNSEHRGYKHRGEVGYNIRARSHCGPIPLQMFFMPQFRPPGLAPIAISVLQLIDPHGSIVTPRPT
ncbi:MAG: hypothetical protein ACYC9N_20640, partial [Thermoanaerobaculia bacterium]